MTPYEHRQQLQDRYATLFAPPGQNVSIDVGDGWLRIIDLLLQRLDTILCDENGTTLRIRQIDEKGGYLRVSYILHSRTEDLRRDVKEAIDLAVRASHRCCERCAHVGDLIQQPRWRVRCADCANLPSRSQP